MLAEPKNKCFNFKHFLNNNNKNTKQKHESYHNKEIKNSNTNYYYPQSAASSSSSLSFKNRSRTLLIPSNCDQKFDEIDNFKLNRTLLIDHKLITTTTTTKR